MKKTALSFCMLATLTTTYASEVITITESEKETIALQLEKEAGQKQSDQMLQKQLITVAQVFRNSSEDVELEKSKDQIVLRKLGRKLGKGSAWVSTTTAKPFVNASSFVVGLFEKKEKNQDVVALYHFFLKHSEEFDDLYLEAGSPEELVELMLVSIDDIMARKTRNILRDFIASLGIKRAFPEELSEFELTDEEIDSLDFSKITPDFINNHPEYQEIKPIIGEVTRSDLEDIILSGYFDTSIGFDNYMAALPKISETAAAIAGQIYGPKLVLGVISKSLAGLYSTPVLAADIGTGISAAICLQDETKDKFENDKDLKSFCSYVVNRSSYELIKSRAKGYLAGKNTRSKIEQKLQERKDKRSQKRGLRPH